MKTTLSGARKFLSNVHVINLDRSADRLAEMTAGLGRYGINFTRFPAVDGSALSDEEIIAETTMSCRTVLCSKSMIGIGMSHRRLWEIIAKSRDQWHLVLEDDAIVSDQTIAYLYALSQVSLPEEAFIFLSRPDGIFSPVNFDTDDDTVLGSGGLLKRLVFCWCTTGYLITPAMARKLLDAVPKVNFHIDAVAAIYAKPHCYASSVRAINTYHDPLGSTNLSGHGAVMPVADHVLGLFGLDELRCLFQGTRIAILMKYHITDYHLFLAALIVCNYLWLRSAGLAMYVLLEVLVFIMLQASSS